ncbi:MULTISPECIES: hypothetical protein [unclassified Streptomyces]
MPSSPEDGTGARPARAGDDLGRIRPGALAHEDEAPEGDLATP